MEKKVYTSIITLLLTAWAWSFSNSFPVASNSKSISAVSKPITSSSSTFSDTNNNTVKLTVSAQGKTKEEAKYNALRDALERAFGTFISSNTQILNDELIKDEIVSISSGNIQHFDIKSEVQLPDGTFSNVVDVTVSVEKLKSYCESRGINVEFQGGLFSANIKLQKMNKENEDVTMNNLVKTIKSLAQSSFDYLLQVEEPTVSENAYLVEVFVEARFNENIKSIENLLLSTMEGIALSESEISTLKSQNSSFYSVSINGTHYFLRSKNTYMLLREIFERIIPYYSTRFKLENGLYTVTGSDCITYKYGSYYIGITNKYFEANWKLRSVLHQGHVNYGRYITTNYNLISKIGYSTIIDIYNYDFTKNLSNRGYDKNQRYLSDLDRDSHKNARESLTEFVYGNGKTLHSDIPKIKFDDIANILIVFPISNILTLNEIEKVTQYSVKPQI